MGRRGIQASLSDDLAGVIDTIGIAQRFLLCLDGSHPLAVPSERFGVRWRIGGADDFSSAVDRVCVASIPSERSQVDPSPAGIETRVVLSFPGRGPTRNQSGIVDAQ